MLYRRAFSYKTALLSLVSYFPTRRAFVAQVQLMFLSQNTFTSKSLLLCKHKQQFTCETALLVINTKSLHPHKGTKARGTTQIPAITGTLMRNVHETDSPTIRSESRLRWELPKFLSPRTFPANEVLSLRQIHSVLYIFTVIKNITKLF